MYGGEAKYKHVRHASVENNAQQRDAYADQNDVAYQFAMVFQNAYPHLEADHYSGKHAHANAYQYAFGTPGSTCLVG